MSNYENWNKKTIDDFSTANVNSFYDQGYKFGRTGKGDMYQSRLVRVNLTNYEPSSENRRVLKKFPNLTINQIVLPIASTDYDWRIHKLGKDFYDSKFEVGIFTASRLKKLLTDSSLSNFNLLLEYKLEDEIVGYAIAYANEQILHYAYPFYKFEEYPSNMGMAMMLAAINLTKEQNLKYIYLGSAQKSTDKYKLQFKGLEWFDGADWQLDIEPLKQILTSQISDLQQ